MLLYPKSLIRSSVKSLREYKFHYSRMSQAKEILKNVEGSKGKTSSSIIKLCDEYAVEVLGHKHFSAWLHVYSSVSGRFKEGWIPDNYYGSVVVPKIKGAYGKVSGLKPLNTSIFGKNVFPDLLSYVNGVFFDTDYRVVSPEAVKSKIFNGDDRVVFKLDNSQQGKGILFFDRDSFQLEKIYELGNGLFQSFIKQHEIFEVFAENSVATIRATTVMEEDGRTSVRACYLRLGSGSDTHVQSKSHIRVPINLQSGAFSDIGYTTEWLETNVHPTSNVKFSGNFVPSFKDAIRLVVELHKKAPYARCIGWDLTVDEENKVRLMEWNAGHNDIKFSEATQGPCFADLHWERLKL